MYTPSLIRWNEEYEARHFDKHGVPFAFAAGVFSDDDRLVQADERHPDDPPRFNAVAVVDGICIHVTYAMAADEAVIISARSASRKERRRYGAHYPL